MNKNSIIGFVLIAAIMIFYTVYMTPSKEEMAAKQRVQDSIARVNQQRFDSVKMLEAAKAIQQEQTQTQLSEPEIQAAQSDDYSNRQSKFALFANAASGEKEIISIFIYIKFLP